MAAAAITDEVVIIYFYFQTKKNEYVSECGCSRRSHKHGDDAIFFGGEKGTNIVVIMQQGFLLDRGFVN